MKSIFKNIFFIRFFVIGIVVAFFQLPLSAFCSLKIENPDSLSSSFCNLDGYWDFYWSTFLPSTEFVSDTPPIPDEIVEIPSVWNRYDCYPKQNKGSGSGTFHLHVANLKPNTLYATNTNDLTGTASRMYCNGTLVMQTGIPAEDWTQTKSARNMELINLKSDSNGEMDLVIHVSNNAYRKGGIWNSLCIAENDYVERYYTNKTNMLFLICGALFALISYQLFLFFFQANAKANICLALFAFVIFLRIISTDFSLLVLFFPNISYALMLKLEYMALYLAPILFMVYLYDINNLPLNDKYFFISLITGTLLGILTMFTPVSISNRLVPFDLCFMLLCAVITLMRLYKIIMRKSRNTLIAMTLSIAFLITTAIYDSINVAFPGATKIKLFNFGVLAFFIIQSAITAIQHEKTEKEICSLSNSLNNAIKMNSFFLPSFTNLLPPFPISSRGFSIVPSTIRSEQQKPSDYAITMNATLLSANIRNFSVVASSNDTATAFSILNNWITSVNAIINSNGGYIVNLNGDQFFAIFPANDYKVFDCAIAMKKELISICKQQTTASLTKLKVGIGIHFGTITLGLAGSDSTVIPVLVSNSLEETTKIEEMTKIVDKTILISGTAVRILHAHNNYTLLKINSENLNDSSIDDIYSLEAQI